LSQRGSAGVGQYIGGHVSGLAAQKAETAVSTAALEARLMATEVLQQGQQITSTCVQSASVAQRC
jgi:hypothetical protein